MLEKPADWLMETLELVPLPAALTGMPLREVTVAKSVPCCAIGWPEMPEKKVHSELLSVYEVPTHSVLWAQVLRHSFKSEARALLPRPLFARVILLPA